jgi:hypothetical protein
VGDRAAAARDHLGLFAIDIGDTDQLDLGKRSENAGVLLAQVPHPDHRNPQA